jgi:hypothetical protein
VDKEQMAIARLQDAARLSLHRYGKPLLITYSCGKDSQVLVALAERSGIDFEVVNSHTTADAPETVYFIREQFMQMEGRGINCTIEKPRYKGKPTSMWSLIPQKMMPPTRLVRYCCAVLKENTGRDRFIATGVRWAESTRRKNSRGVMELMHKDPAKRIILMGDNDEKRQLFETCNLKKRFSCFAVAVVLLTLTTLWATACGSTSAEAGTADHPCYHVTVYSPAIEDGTYAARRYPKYTITVDDFGELLPDQLSAERDYQLLRIPRSDGRFELVSTSLVEIEYY